MKHSTKTTHSRVKETATRKSTSAHLNDQIVRTLALRVRCMSIQQVARTWWPGLPERTCLTRLKPLISSGRVHLFTMLSHPEVPMVAPLAVWQPDLDIPDMGAVAHRARQRWTLPSVSTVLVVASEVGATRFDGVSGRCPRISEATHDVHVASVYLRMLEELPVRAASWQSETLIASRRRRRGFRPPSGEKVPDAMVRDGCASTAIEFVGDYSPDKLRAFHHYCRKHNLGYELW